MHRYYSGREITQNFNAVRKQMDQMFRSIGLAQHARAASGETFPQLNIGATTDALEIVAFAPGIDTGTLQVVVDKDRLTISGERKSAAPESDESLKAYARERAVGAFRRVVELPADADPERVDARYRDGCLYVSIQKRESSKPRLINVQ